MLPQPIAYLEAAGAATITAELAIAWAGLPARRAAHHAGRTGWEPSAGSPATCKTIDPATEVPPAGIWPVGHAPARNPIWAEADISRLLAAARALRPPLRAATYETLLGLLAATGMRVGEAIGLDRADIDLDGGVLTIADAQVRPRPAWCPLHPSVTRALRDVRRPPRPAMPAARQQRRFFVSSAGTRAARQRRSTTTFAQLTTALGLRTDGRPVPGFMI